MEERKDGEVDGDNEEARTEEANMKRKIASFVSASDTVGGLY